MTVATMKEFPNLPVKKGRKVGVPVQATTTDQGKAKGVIAKVLVEWGDGKKTWEDPEALTTVEGKREAEEVPEDAEEK